jgi:DnaJ-class molecular chaperone
MNKPETQSGGSLEPVGSVPFKCPVCEGTGLVSRPPWVAGDVPEWTAAQTQYPCRTCDGTGVMWEQGSPNGEVSDGGGPKAPEFANKLRPPPFAPPKS